MLRKLLVCCAAVGGLLATSVPGTAIAAPAPGKTATVKAENSTNAAVTCAVQAQDPVRQPSRHRVYGDGVITGCGPHNPDVCTVQTDLQIYIHGSWATEASGPKKSGPPCQGLTSRAIHKNCTHTDTAYAYRTSTVMAIVEGGDHDTAHDHSSAVRYHCL